LRGTVLQRVSALSRDCLDSLRIGADRFTTKDTKGAKERALLVIFVNLVVVNRFGHLRACECAAPAPIARSGFR
jgi:hypothetical protein